MTLKSSPEHFHRLIAASLLTGALSLCASYSPALSSQPAAKHPVSPPADASAPTFTDSEVDCLTVQGLGKFSQADFAGAVEEFTRAIKLMPKRGTLYLQRGLAHLELNNYEKSLADFDQALLLEHGNLLALRICRGKAFMGMGRYKEALAEFDKATQADPRVPLAYIGRAETYLTMGEDAKSLSDLEAALKLDPEQPHAYFLRALYYKKNKEKEKALLDLNRAIELDRGYLNKDADLCKERDRRLSKGDDLAEILKLGKKGSRAASLIGRGLALERAGDHLAAIKELSDAILNSPDSFEAYKWRASLYMDMSSFEMAITDLSKAIEILPNDAELYASRAKAQLEMGNTEKSIDDYTKAIDLAPRQASMFNARGLVYSRSGNSPFAIADFTRAIELAPADSPAYLNRGLEFMVEKNYKAAEGDLSKAIELKEQPCVAYKFRGQARREIGDRKGAIEDLEKSALLYEQARDLFGSKQVARLLAQLRKEN